MKRLFIPGHPVGYEANVRRQTTRRQRQRDAYRKTVQAEARVAGIRLPLTATEAAPVFIQTMATFASRVHPDPENVHKAIVDALFAGAKGGDKYVGGQFEWPSYDPDAPGVWVTIHAPGRKPRRMTA